MEEIKTSIKNMLGYMGRKYFNILCYANDEIQISDNGNDFQRVVFRRKKNNMKISTQNTKSMAIAKEPPSCR